MAFLNQAERRQAEAIAHIGYCNPFLPERLKWERQVLGDQFRKGAAVINFQNSADADFIFGNFELLLERAQVLTDQMRVRTLDGRCTREIDQHVYRENVLFLLYGKYFSLINPLPEQSQTAESRPYAARWEPFLKDYQWYLHIAGVELPNYFDAIHCFSIFRQLDQAFRHIFMFIIGGSMPTARLRATIWESIFTHDMGRYIRGVYKTLGDITTLITGPSGTGKELVAQAIGLSSYQRFNSKSKTFDDEHQTQLLAVNLSALSSALIESELFGHCKGAFTGAIGDRKGWLEVCSENGSVFLDEIGELEQSIQVKLLRVLQTQQFSRVGESKARNFEGKFIAATNRELETEIQNGRFREDLYYRLCADRIQTPTLREQLVDRPEDLHVLTRFIAARLLRHVEEEVDTLASETVDWIQQHFGSEYGWPGNIRELEQCVRNVLIRKSCLPTTRSIGSGVPVDSSTSDAGLDSHFIKAMLAGELTLDEVTQGYASRVYHQVGRYDLAARTLGVNWRTVRSKVLQHHEATSVHRP